LRQAAGGGGAGQSGADDQGIKIKIHSSIHLIQRSPVRIAGDRTGGAGTGPSHTIVYHTLAGNGTSQTLNFDKKQTKKAGKTAGNGQEKVRSPPQAEIRPVGRRVKRSRPDSDSDFPAAEYK